MSQSATSYYRAAEALQEAIQVNRADCFFASNDKNRLVYVFDTNVMESYLRTSKRETSESSVSFGELFNDRVAREVGHRLTTEFLLSGGLPGQRDEPAYLSSFHWNELFHRIGNLEREVAKMAAGPPVLSRAQMEDLERLQEINDAKQFVADASRVIPSELLEVLGRAEAVTRRLQRSFRDRNCVRPLDNIDEWQVAKDRVFRNDVRKWAGDLKGIRDETGKHRLRPSNLPVSDRQADEARLAYEERRRIENDAQTLAGIEALFRENEEACGDDRTLAFHFVTLDQSILTAVANRRAELASEGIPMFARHPRVFAPILNFSGMARAITGVQWEGPVAGVFSEVERAIEQLFELDYGESDTPNPHNKSVRENIRRWEDAARQLITINSAFFADDFSAIEAVIRRLQREDSIAAGGELLKETIASIRTDHALLLSGKALDHLRRNLSDLNSGRAPVGIRRAPVKIIGVQLVATAKPRLEASQSLDEMLDGILGRGEPAEITKTIDSLRSQLNEQWDSASGQLLAACVYLAIGGWQSARECADRSRQLVTGPANKNVTWREASYAKALATRFSIKSRSDFDEAASSLFKNVNTWSFSRDPNARLACLRDKIELAALQQTVAVLQAIEDDTPFARLGIDETPLEILTPEEVRDVFEESALSMQDTQEVLDEEYSGQTANPYLMRSLRRQLAINIVGAHVFRKLLGERVSKTSFEERELMAALEALIDVRGFIQSDTGQQTRGVPPIGQIYGTCAQFLLDPSKAPVQSTLGLIGEIVHDNILPYSDIVELKYLRDNLLASASSGQGSGPAEPRVAMMERVKGIEPSS